MSYVWKRIPNYLRSFGVLPGLWIFVKIHLLPRKQGALFAVRPNGQQIWLRQGTSDASIFFQIIVQREYETKEWPSHHRQLIKRYEELTAKRRTPIIIDAGANIGLASFWFATTFPKARIFSIEPEENNQSLLRLNTAGFPNVVNLAGAIWNQPANLTIENAGVGTAAFRVSENAGTVLAFTVPEIVQGHENDLLIVKIDIEGGEAALFSSNTEWCDYTNLLIVELHDWLYPGEGTSRNFLRVAAEREGDFLVRGENAFFFRPCSEGVGGSPTFLSLENHPSGVELVLDAAPRRAA